MQLLLVVVLVVLLLLMLSFLKALSLSCTPFLLLAFGVLTLEDSWGSFPPRRRRALVKM